jgi:peptide/nickel transport system permease protein
MPASGVTQGTLDTALESQTARRSRRQSLWGSIRQQRLAMTGAVLVIFFAFVALIGPEVAPYGPTEQFTADRLQPPSTTYLFGTDEFGRDIFSRLLYGARISFQVGAIAVGIAGTLGILLAIAIISLLGNNLTNAMIAIAVVYMPTFMRIVRGATLSVRHTAYVESAVSLGASTPRVLAAHVFPNITAPLIVHVSLVFAFAVLAEASLAFLGLGNKPPAPSWGSMVSASYGFLQLAPWAAIVPGVAIALAVLGFNLLGDGLRDALDPRSRGL